MQPSLLDLISSYSTTLANGNQIGGFIIAAVAILLFASSFIPTPMPRDDFSEAWGDWPHVDRLRGGSEPVGEARHSLLNTVSHDGSGTNP